MANRTLNDKWMFNNMYDIGEFKNSCFTYLLNINEIPCKATKNKAFTQNEKLDSKTIPK